MLFVLLTTDRLKGLNACMHKKTFVLHVDGSKKKVFLWGIFLIQESLSSKIEIYNRKNTQHVTFFVSFRF